MHDDIVTLQEMLAHQSVEIAQLSEELYKQQKEMSHLKKQLALLIDKVRELEANGSQTNQPFTPEPPPPHY